MRKILVSAAIGTVASVLYVGPAGAGQTIWRAEWDRTSFDARSGDTLNYVMSPLGDWVERANDWGCEPMVLFPDSEYVTFTAKDCDF